MDAEPALESLNKFFLAGESVPLVWVVQYGQQFQEIWDSSKRPELMIQIALRVVSPKRFVLAMAAVAKAAILKFKNSGLSGNVEMPEIGMSERAVDTVEKWARGKAEIDRVLADMKAVNSAGIAGEAKSDGVVISLREMLHASFHVGNMAVVNNAINRMSSASVVYNDSLSVIDCLNGRSLRSTPDAAREELADVVRSVITSRDITLAGVVAAARATVR